MNPVLKRIEAKKIGEHGRVSEKRVARRLGARPTIASGNQGDKGDYHLPGVVYRFRGENKSTYHSSMVMDFVWLAKIKQEARNKDETAMLTLDFVNRDGSSRKDGQWVCLPLDVFEEMLERVNGIHVSEQGSK